jgi:hypothetical protein
MKIEDDTTKKYKKVTKFISVFVPIFERYIPRRFEKYLEFAGDDGLARRGILFGDGPSLLVRKTETVDGHPYQSNGFSRATEPDLIYFEQRNMDKFEGNTSKYEIALQYLVLHELIHWVRRKAGLPRRLAGGGEVGDAFEVSAYGRDMSIVWDTGAIKCDRGRLRL